MNKSQINLVSMQRSNSLERNRVVILRSLSIIFLSFVAFFSILLFILGSRISVENVKRQQKEALQKITLLKERAAKYTLLNDRLRIIKTLVVSRKDPKLTLDSILGQLPPQVNVRGLTVDRDGVTLSITSNSLLPINEFLSRVTTNLEKKVIREMTIEGLTIDSQTGIYTLSLKAKSI